MPTNDTKPSAGAMKAANAILDRCEGRPLPSSDEIRDIIDQHTAHRELVEALRKIELSASDEGQFPHDDDLALNQIRLIARQALASAGEQ